MVKFRQAIVAIIFTLTASTLADQLCQCYFDDWFGVSHDEVSTKACCDKWENAGAIGVKYSGTWDDVCIDPNSVIVSTSWNDCCIDQGVLFGACG